MTGPVASAATQLDIDTPNAARLHDYLLGGAHNFQADREWARRLVSVWPAAPAVVRADRDFLRRVVQFMIGAGVRQFLDLGSGIPTVGNVHEVAQRMVPDTRVVYVDNDPAAVTHGRLVLSGNPRAAIVHADLTHPAEVLAAEETRALLDFRRPIGLLMVAVCHLIAPDWNACGVLSEFRDALAPDSWLGMSHRVVIDGSIDVVPAAADPADLGPAPAADQVIDHDNNHVRNAFSTAVPMRDSMHDHPHDHLHDQLRNLTQVTAQVRNEASAPGGSPVEPVMPDGRNPIYPRTRTEITELFDGFDIVEPGVVPTSLWRPDNEQADAGPAATVATLAGVGRRR